MKLSVFTKPWRFELPDLAKHIAGLGFDAIELPVRPGYPVTPENIATELPKAVQIMADHGLEIASIAGPTDEKTMAACAALGIPIIRICVGMQQNESYMLGEARLQREYDLLVPLLAKHGVTLGLQNHYGNRDVCNAMGLRHLAEKYDPKQIALVWDAGHTGLEGEAPESAIDIVWDHLCMVNLKSAFWNQKGISELGEAFWEPIWTIGKEGRANWSRVITELKRRAYSGTICLTAEYSDEESVDRFIAQDIAFAKDLISS